MNPKTKASLVTAVMVLLGGGVAAAHAFGAIFPQPPPSVSPPASYGGNPISATCSSDATLGLDGWIASLPNNTVIEFPTNACYTVSAVSPGANQDNGLVINGQTGITIIGNGTEINQPVYSGCGGAGQVDPILNIYNATSISISGLDLVGPGGASGGVSCEGDYGVIIQGSTSVLFNSNTINGPMGDGMWIISLNNNGTRLDYGVTVENNLIEDYGYHGITPEGVINFLFANNTVENAGPNSADAIDMESDSTTVTSGGGCGTRPYPSSTCTLENAAEVNITIYHNTWINVQGGFMTSYQSGIIVTNVRMIDNVFSQTSGSSFCCNGWISMSSSTALVNPSPPYLGIIVEGNIVETPFSAGGSCPFMPGCVGGAGLYSFNNVTDLNLQSNTTQLFDGFGPPVNYNQPGGGPAYIFGLTLDNVTTALIKNNVLSGSIGVTTDQPGNNPWSVGPNTGVTECNNAYGFNSPNATNGVGTVPPPSNDGAC